MTLIQIESAKRKRHCHKCKEVVRKDKLLLAVKYYSGNTSRLINICSDYLTDLTMELRLKNKCGNSHSNL